MPSKLFERDQIVRFRISERQMHWAVAVPFMICYATALVLVVVYNAHPQRPYRVAVSWTHRASGLALFILPVWTIFQHWYDVSIHRLNIREAWRWTLEDVKWLLLMGPSTVSKKIVLPEQGKFNAAEKVNFMALMATLPIYLVSGLLIWFHQFFFSAWVVHLSAAATATVLMGGHIFMATVNPDTRVGLSGMITGLVDRHWALHHYGRWYRENFADPDAAEPSCLETEAVVPDEASTRGSTRDGAGALEPGASRVVDPDDGEDPILLSIELADSAGRSRGMVSGVSL
jgi:formate dehydrogenase subunit gamma